jgi:hypothetical protein
MPDNDRVDALIEVILNGGVPDASAEPDDVTGKKGLEAGLELIGQIALFNRVLHETGSTHTAVSETASTLRQAPEQRDTEFWLPAGWTDMRPLRRLGSGSYGDVFECWDSVLQRRVALKLLRGSSDRPEDLEGLYKEGRALAAVNHANVVRVFGVELRDDHLGLAMEFIEGRTLRQLVQQDGPLGHLEAALIGIDLCSALARVHGAGIVHLDVKAANVMRESGGRYVLMDFGVGRRLSPGEQRSGAIGTPLCMAPEVLGGGDYDHRADMYSLGVLLYYLVSGRYPIEVDSLQELQTAHTDSTRTNLRDLRPELPAAFVRVVEKAIAPDPADRYATAGELRSNLEALLESSGTTTGTTLATSVPARSTGSSKPIARAAAALAVIALVVWAAWFTGSPELTAEVHVVVDPAAARQALVDTDSVDAGDRIGVLLATASPLHAYVFNADEAGELYWLFPLDALDTQNPLPAGQHVLPGTADGAELAWSIGGAGPGREQFIVVLSAGPLVELEAVFGDLAIAKQVILDGSAPVVAVPKSAIELVAAADEEEEVPPLVRLRRLLDVYQQRPDVRVVEQSVSRGGQ